MSDPYDLQRFVEAQDPVYDRVCSELREARKRSHWMWFIFPQIMGLGSSPLARRFAISSLLEATTFPEHPILGRGSPNVRRSSTWSRGARSSRSSAIPMT